MPISNDSICWCASASRSSIHISTAGTSLVQNHHKPLEMIHHKPIHAAPPHLQYMLLCMQKYDYTIQYKPRKEIILANCLSCFPSHKESLPIAICQNIKHIQLTNNKINTIQGAIEQDLVYNTLYCLNLRGWPRHLQQVLRIAHHFWGALDELTIKDSILLKGDWVCTPKLLNWTLADFPQCAPGDGENAVLSQRGSVLAWYWCRYHSLHREMPYPHQT